MTELNVFANDLQKELTCSICEEIFTNPRTLKCLHSFCLQCISDWNASCRCERRPLTCPSCRSVERLEGNDVSSLPSPFYLDSLLQLLQDVRISAQTQYQQELPSVTVEEAAEEVKASIKLGINQLNKVKERYMEELTLSKQNVARIEQEINAAIKKVSDEVEQHIKVLRDHETAVIETLQRKLQQIKGQNDEEQREIRDGIESISEFNLRAQTLLDENVPHFIVKSQEELSQRCEALLEKPSILSSKQVERTASVCYTPNPQVTQALKDIGQVMAIDPSRCSIERLNDIWRGFEVVTRNSQNELCVTNQDLVDVHIQDGDGINVEKKVSQSETGKYTVTYKAENACDYTIHVRINGQDIKNSPQIVKINAVRREFEPSRDFAKDVGVGRLTRLWSKYRSIAVRDTGEVAIVDCGNNRIVIFSADGEHLRDFSEKVSNPRAVIFNGDRLLVTTNEADEDDITGRLQEFDLNGTYRRTIYKHGDVALRGMCTANENIAVCYINIKKSKSGIKVLNKESGQLMQKISSVDKYEEPTNIAYGKGKYFVSYASNHYVRVFDVNGDFLYKFGINGNKHGQFKHPRGLAVVSDVVLVCDDGNGRIQMFSQDGRFLSSFANRRTGLGLMDGPMDVVIAADGRVFVVERNNRVKVWR